MENPLDLFFAVFTAAVATMIYFGVIDNIPHPIITVIVVLMLISSFFDVIA